MTANGNPAAPWPPLAELGPADPVPEWVWHEPAMLADLGARNMTAVYRRLCMYGLSHRALATRTGQAQADIWDIVHSRRRVGGYDLLCRIADSLGIPRGYLGLAYLGPSPADRDAAVLDRPLVPPEPVDVVVHVVTVSECQNCSQGQPSGADRSGGGDSWTAVEALALRRALGMSLHEFARHIGVHRQTISGWNRREPRLVHQHALRYAYSQVDPLTREAFVAHLPGAATRVASLRDEAAVPDADGGAR